MNKNITILLIIFLEGFVVLASELLILRRIIPYAGSSISVTAIIISFVLLPLAIGYYHGGRYSKNTIRKKLNQNLINASISLMIGFSLWTFFTVFELLTMISDNNILHTSLYMTSFFIYPIYLLGQTIPLTSNYFTNDTLTHITGKILFFSTLGSLIGSIFTTLVLVNYLGVSVSIIFTLFSIFLISVILNKRKQQKYTIIIAIIITLFAITEQQAHKKFDIKSDKLYSTIRIHNINLDYENSKILSINNSSSAKTSDNPEKRFKYLTYIEDNIIDIQYQNRKKDILIIGSGGFTIGLNDNFNNYTYIDIDKGLKKISEQYFLNKKLQKNKKFIVQPARAFLNNHKKKYDIIIADTYSNRHTIPSQLVTIEFFQSIKKHLKKSAIIAFNIISYPRYFSLHSNRVDNSLNFIFPNITKHIIGEYSYQKKDSLRNILYIYVNNKIDNKIYSDDLNNSDFDRLKTKS